MKQSIVCSILIASAILIAFCGCAMADRLVNATPEIQGISTSTSIACQGTVSETDSLSWAISNQATTTPPLDDSEVVYQTGYNDNLMAVSGQTTWVKTAAVSTANKIGDQSNVAMNANLQYIAIDTGRATRSEDILLDGAGNATPTSSAILCPFATATSSTIPQYCNIVQAGSSIDTTLTSVVTSATDRFVGTDSTYPVALNYNIAASGITLSDGTSSPMIGSASAFVKAHIQEARNGTGKAEDLTYSETSTASGYITKFGKSIAYQSGMNLI
jgi:hypothetical protein